MSALSAAELTFGHETLPRALTSLVGRVEETASLAALLSRDDVRLVTLVGPGGVGKTRLAIHVAHEVVERFPDGVVFVPLVPIADPGQVPTAIAHALGLPDLGTVTCGEDLVAFLGPRRMLLILDNVEHLLPATTLFAQLLAAAAQLTILATSRVVLRLSGEHASAVPPLPLPGDPATAPVAHLRESDAVRLFIERAQAVRPALDLSEPVLSAIATICRRLDGLPLAIELAAARANVLSPQAMAIRLERRLPLLTSGPRDGPARQQTMRDTIAWSFDLLPRDERALFRRLSVFVGRFTVEAAERVISAFEATGLDIFDGIASLVDKSLLRSVEDEDGESRFLMLGTIREFALEQLEAAGERDTAGHAHADWFLQLAVEAERTFFGPGEQAWLRRLEKDRANLRAALTFLLDMGERDRFLRLTAVVGRLWYKRELYSEGAPWLERAAVLAQEVGPTRDAAMILDNLGKLAGMQGDFTRATGFFQRSVDAWRALGDNQGLAREIIMLADAYRLSEVDDKALPYFQEAMAMLRNLEGEDFWRATALRGLGVLALRRGDINLAEQHFTEAHEMARSSGGAWAISAALRGLGQVTSLRGHHPEALAMLRESLSIAWGIRDRIAVVLTLPALAEALTAADESEGAARLFGATTAARDTIIREAGSLPRLLTQHDGMINTLRIRLGATTFERVWAEGRGLTIEGAVTEAMALVEHASDGHAHPHHHGGQRGHELPGGLSEREAEVLRLTAAGLSNSQIAERLFLSPHTVRAHLHRIYAKLEITNRADAVRYAVDHGLL